MITDVRKVSIGLSNEFYNNIYLNQTKNVEVLDVVLCGRLQKPFLIIKSHCDETFGVTLLQCLIIPVDEPVKELRELEQDYRYIGTLPSNTDGGLVTVWARTYYRG